MLLYTIIYCSIQFYYILNYSILYNATLYYIMLFYTVQFYAIVCYSILKYTSLYYTIPLYAILHYFVRCTIQGWHLPMRVIVSLAGVIQTIQSIPTTPAGPIH